MKTRLKFSKIGTMKFIGHLDIMRYFQKTFRRGEIDIAYSKGFRPHQQISFAAPLGIGLTSEGEYVDVELISLDNSAKMIEKFNKNSNPEIEVTSWKRLSDDSKNAMSIVTAADYAVLIKEFPFSYDDLQKKFICFLEQKTISVIKKTKRKEAEVDIRPLIWQYAFEAEKFLEKGGKNSNLVKENQFEQPNIYLKLATGSVNHLKPEIVMQAFCEYLNIDYKSFDYQIHRIEIYGSDEKQAQKIISLDSFGEEL